MSPREWSMLPVEHLTCRYGDLLHGRAADGGGTTENSSGQTAEAAPAGEERAEAAEPPTGE